MNRFKRLNTLKIFNNDIPKDMEEKEIEPFFNKPGRYLDRYYKTSWYEIETNKGIRAFKSSVESFNHSLELALHNPLTKEELKAVSIAVRVCNSKKLHKLYRIDLNWKEIRNTRIDARLWVRSVLKKVENE